jgi:hypothetical protein
VGSGAEETDQRFQEKLALWGRRAKYRKFANFPLYDEITPDLVYPVELKFVTVLLLT